MAARSSIRAFLILLRLYTVEGIFFSNPATVTVGQAFTVTWLDPPQNPTQFGIGIPDGASDNIHPEELIAVTPAGQRNGAIALLAPSTTGEFVFGAYTLETSISILGMGAPILVVAAADASARYIVLEHYSAVQNEPFTSISQPVPTSSTSDTQSINIGEIIGGALGGVMFLLLVVVLLLLRRQHTMRKQSHGVQPASIHPFRFWEHHSSSVNDSEAADSTNDTDAQEGSIAISNRNTEIPVPSQYRSRSDIFKKMKKGPRKIQSNVQGSDVGSEVANTAWNTTPAAQYQNIPVSPRPTRRTTNILRHLDSGIRIFQEVNTRRENQNGDSESVVEKAHESQSANTAEEVIELPPEYSRT